MRQDYIGESELAPEPLMEEVITGETVTLQNATFVIPAVNKTGQSGFKQAAFISNNMFNPVIVLNPRYIVDIRGIPKKSPLRKAYDQEIQTARTKNAGITIVKNMPQTLPPRHGLN